MKETRFNLIAVLQKYLKESVTEFSKISWPTKEQAVLLTGVVVAFGALFSLFLAGLDFGFSELYRLALSKIAS